MAISNEQLASMVQSLLDKWLLRERQEMERENGTVTGGPNGNGYYPVTDASGTVTLRPSPAKIALMAASPQVINLSGAGPFTLTLAQAGNRIRVSNGTATAAITINVPSVPIGTVWFVRQSGPAPLRFVGASGETVVNRLGYNGTAGPNASVALCRESSNITYLDGDVGTV